MKFEIYLNDPEVWVLTSDKKKDSTEYDQVIAYIRDQVRRQWESKRK